MSDCAKKRDSSNFSLIGYPSKKTFINYLALGVRLLPPAIAHQKKNRPVNTRPATTDGFKSNLVVISDLLTGLIKGRGGEKKGSSHLKDYPVHPLLPPFADSKYGGFPSFFSSAPPYLIIWRSNLPKKFAKSCYAEVDIG